MSKQGRFYIGVVMICSLLLINCASDESADNYLYDRFYVVTVLNRTQWNLNNVSILNGKDNSIQMLYSDPILPDQSHTFCITTTDIGQLIFNISVQRPKIKKGEILTFVTQTPIAPNEQQENVVEVLENEFRVEATLNFPELCSQLVTQPPLDMSASDMSASDMFVSVSDMSASDMSASDMSASDMSASDMSVSDMSVSVSDLSMTDMSTMVD
jgi:hypothetical protein